jgi:hypothetical protein
MFFGRSALHSNENVNGKRACISSSGEFNFRIFLTLSPLFLRFSDGGIRNRRQIIELRHIWRVIYKKYTKDVRKNSETFYICSYNDLSAVDGGGAAH